MHARLRLASLLTAVTITSAIVFSGAARGSTTIEPAGAGIKFTVDLVDADGKANHWTITANFDGKDSPVVGTSPYGDMAAFTRVDARTIRIVSKQGGKPTVTQTIAVAADGKTRTTTTKGTGANGQPIDTVAIYEKQ